MKKGNGLLKGQTRLAFGNVSLHEESGDDTWKIKFDADRFNPPEIWTRQEVLNGIRLAIKYANHDRTNIRSDGTKAPPLPPPVSYYILF